MGSDGQPSLRARIRGFVESHAHVVTHDPTLRRDLDALRVEVGRLNAARVVAIDDLVDAEFRVFSQFGEDGIIQWLVHRIEIPDRTFVEFGVQDYRESNTRFLVELDDWSGVAIDASDAHRAFLERSEIAWRHNVDAAAGVPHRGELERRDRRRWPAW